MTYQTGLGEAEQALIGEVLHLAPQPYCWAIGGIARIGRESSHASDHGVVHPGKLSGRTEYGKWHDNKAGRLPTRRTGQKAATSRAIQGQRQPIRILCEDPGPRIISTLVNYRLMCFRASIAILVQ